MAQHKDHAAAWNAVLTKNNAQAGHRRPLTITKARSPCSGQAKSVADVAKLALGLENAAAETYTFATVNVHGRGRHHDRPRRSSRSRRCTRRS